MENPPSSDAWSEFSLGEVWTCRLDQCMLGLKCPASNEPVLKPTRIVSTQESLPELLGNFRCDQSHQHAHLEGRFKGKNLTEYAETYPRKFVQNIVKSMLKAEKSSKSYVRVEDVFAEDSDLEPPLPALEDRVAAEHPQQDVVATAGDQGLNPKGLQVHALVNKLHVNTGHASPEQMLRLAVRCRASEEIKNAIRSFKCSVCDELKPLPSHRKAAMPHAEQPNQIVGIDFVQVDLRRTEQNNRKVETKFNVLTCVDLATGFCQQIVVPPGPNKQAKAFHEAWSRPYGVPNMIYMDPAHSSMSVDFQSYLAHHQIQLLHCAAEAHHQIGQVEVANRVLRGMAQRLWQTAWNRPPEEIIELCSSVRNDQLRKAGFSPAQWFLGKNPRHAGMLTDLDEQHNMVTQSQFCADPSFAEKVLMREEACRAFIEEHAKDVWRRAVAYRNRPMRGPYVAGQMVYVFRLRGRGQLRSRHGQWLGPGRIIGVESSSNSPIPRLVWVSLNGYLYRCSPENLRPVPEDEQNFKELARQLEGGLLSKELEDVPIELHTRGQFGQYYDLVGQVPTEADFELADDVEAEPDPLFPEESSEGGPRKVRRRFYRSIDYWEDRARGAPPRGALQEGPMPAVLDMSQPHASAPSRDQPFDEDSPEKRRRVEFQSDAEEMSYEPSLLDPEEQRESIFADPDAPGPSEMDLEAPSIEPAPLLDAETTDPPIEDTEMSGIDVPVPEPAEDELLITPKKLNKNKQEMVFEISFDVHPEDITDDMGCLWSVLEDCFEASPKKERLRRVEVNFRKLNDKDKALFLQAMKKEWNSWIDNKVTSVCKSRGISPDRIIRARWVLVWKKSSDPDVDTRTPKARLVLVGWQDPELGKIATDSPTLRKESKGLILSICASRRWKLWGADIKTAFLSGDPTSRNLYFKPPREIKQWMQLSDTDLFKLEKAAYGLAEAPRPWFERLRRELLESGLIQSKLDPCLFMLIRDQVLLGICGIHVDDLLGGGEKEMDEMLQSLKKRLPFGDYRTHTIRYTGMEIRQNPSSMSIEVGQESYIESLQQVETKPLGTSQTALPGPSILRTCAGQLARVANSTRPDMSFLASYLQGVQDKGVVAHVQMYNKAVREMKSRKICLNFPSGIPIDQWRIVAFCDAGWNSRANGESQGGYILCLTTPEFFKHKPAKIWVIDWSSKKLRRVVRSSTAAETLAGQNGLDAIEMFQGLLHEVLWNIGPRKFREMIPEHPSALVTDSKGFYDAITRSCCSQALSIERRLAIDYAIAKETMQNQNIIGCWVNNLQMCADALTKLKGDTKPLYELLEKGVYRLKVNQESGRKEKAKSLEEGQKKIENTKAEREERIEEEN